MPVKIANYELLAPRPRDCSPSLDLRFDLVVLDEAQRIKNRGQRHQPDRFARSPARRSWALTGTPVENSPEDLVGIFEFLAPGYLSTTMKPRRMGKAAVRLRAAPHEGQGAHRPAAEDVSRRRGRAHARAGASYERAENEGVVRLTEMAAEATIQHVFELVLRLKQICNFDPATGDSAKLERLAADLEEVAASGRKAIVFSQWVDTLETLAGRLGAFAPPALPRRRQAQPARRRDRRSSATTRGGTSC